METGLAPEVWTLREVQRVPLAPAHDVEHWGETLVLAPNPHDASLGCGGAIALLRQRGVNVTIAVITDGRASHPDSRLYPASVLIEQRQQQVLDAAATLGVDESEVQFLHLEDFQINKLSPRQKAFLIKRLRSLVKRTKTVLTPWRLDPNCDHRATFGYTLAAVGELPVRILEYPIRLWQNGVPADYPPRANFSILRLDISTVLPRKVLAFSAHHSQPDDGVSKDSNQFRSFPQVLSESQPPWELFFSRK